MRAVKGIAAALVLAALPWSAAQAHVGFGIGINLGAPYYYHPYYYHPYPYYYYQPYPVYAAPPTVVIQSAPVVRPAYASPVDTVPEPTETPVAPPPTIAPQPVQPASLGQDPVREQMQSLGNADDRVRAEAAVELGRMKVKRAVQPLMQVLAGDRSASVREAAARALGLIGDTATLPALQRAAQADDDHDVRHSAQFAAEVIRSNMPH